MKKINKTVFFVSAIISFFVFSVSFVFLFWGKEKELYFSPISFLEEEPEKIYIELFEEEKERDIPLSFCLSRASLSSTSERELSLSKEKKEKLEKLYQRLSTAKIKNDLSNSKGEKPFCRIVFLGSHGKRLELFGEKTKDSLIFKSPDNRAFLSKELKSALNKKEILKLFPSLFESVFQKGEILSLKVFPGQESGFNAYKSGFLFLVSQNKAEKESYLCHEKELYLSLKSSLNSFEFLCPFGSSFLLKEPYNQLILKSPSAVLDIILDEDGERKMKTIKFFSLKSKAQIVALSQNSSVYVLDLKKKFSPQIPRRISLSDFKKEDLKGFYLRSKGVQKEISFENFNDDTKTKKVLLNGKEIRCQEIFEILSILENIKPEKELFTKSPESLKLKIKIGFQLENQEKWFINFYDLEEKELLYFGKEKDEKELSPTNSLIVGEKIGEKLLEEFEKL